MAREIEVKLKVEAHDPIRGRLRGLGAECLGSVNETNRLFDDAGDTLRRGDRGLRIRECRDDAGRITAAFLTYKGPRETSGLKQREELEVRIDDAATARAILESLGYRAVIGFEKRRETWLLGGCHVELDELPHLGAFVEVEGPSDAAIHAVQDQLGLAGEAPVPETYIALLARYCEEHGLPRDLIVFV